MNTMETAPVYTTEQVQLVERGRVRLFWLGLAVAAAVAANVAAGLIAILRSF